jgi:hypothetical protein
MPADSSVELRVSANTLRVINTEVSDGTRAKIQDTMGSAQVLEVERFSEIHFSIDSGGSERRRLLGRPRNLHGKTLPNSVDVALRGGLYRCTATLKQTTFGITPIKIARGNR